MNNHEKESLFCFPKNVEYSFARKLSTLTAGQTTLTVATKIRGHDYAIHLCINQSDQTSYLELPCDGHAHHVALAYQNDRTVALLWNEYTNDKWHLKYAVVDLNKNEITKPISVTTNQYLMYPPAATYGGRGLAVTWPQSDGHKIRIHVATLQSNHWHLHGPVSSSDVDAFRPVIDMADSSIFIAWDQYKNKTYETILASSSNSTHSFCELQKFGKKNERWFTPTITAITPTQVYVICLVLQTITDDRGVVDNHPFAAGGVWTGQNMIPLVDKNNAEDSRIIADFSDGTLPRELYKGYVGWRRKPQLTRTDDAKVYLLWESRPEETKTSIDGQLLMRELNAQGTCGRTTKILCGGYSYAVAAQCPKDQIIVGQFNFKKEGSSLVTTTSIFLTSELHYPKITAKAPRWNKRYIKPTEPNRLKIQHKNEHYAMFWADTHCHSHFSPDAEGEVDELIHFARDVAGLDALCVIDNDYYPHKALMDAEWQIHQAHSKHFTKKNQFVLFPGYEFTFHDRALTPHFNHRCMVFQEAGGNLIRRIDPGIDHETKIYAAINDTPVMCYPHHPTYRLSDSTREWNVEISSSWRVCFEESDFSKRQLKAGHVFGFIGSSDTHRVVPGLGGAITGILATELTPKALFEAYKARRIIATQGEKIAIDFRINDHLIGSEIQSTKAPSMTVHVQCATAIEFIEIMRDGQAIDHLEINDTQCDYAFTDKTPLVGKHFYFLRVKLQGATSFNDDPALNNHWPFTTQSNYPHNLAKAHGCFAWTSPIWVTT